MPADAAMTENRSRRFGPALVDAGCSVISLSLGAPFCRLAQRGEHSIVRYGIRLGMARFEETARASADAAPKAASSRRQVNPRMTAAADTMSTPSNAAKALTLVATPRTSRSRPTARPNGSAMTLADRQLVEVERRAGCSA